nr:hypothetical protein [Tanacetum cinerariifolium]
MSSFNQLIKSSIEDLVPILCESEGISNDTFDVPFSDNSPHLDVLNDHFEVFSDFNDDCTPCDDFSPINIFEEKFVTFSNPFFEFDDEYISSDVNPLFDEVLENIESNDSYDSNLDELDLLVTLLFDVNKDECFDPGGDTDEINAFLNIDNSMNINDGYHDSKGDIIYLEGLLTNETIPILPSKVFLDHDTKSLKDESDSKNMVKILDLGIHEKISFPTYDCPDFEDSRARGFVHRPLKLLSLAYGNPISLI